MWGLSLLPQSYALWRLIIARGSCVFPLIRLPPRPAWPILPLLSPSSRTLSLIRIELSGQSPCDSLHFTSDRPTSCSLAFTICFPHSSLILSLRIQITLPGFFMSSFSSTLLHSPCLSHKHPASSCLFSLSRNIEVLKMPVLTQLSAPLPPTTPLHPPYNHLFLRLLSHSPLPFLVSSLSVSWCSCQTCRQVAG